MGIVACVVKNNIQCETKINDKIVYIKETLNQKIKEDNKRKKQVMGILREMQVSTWRPNSSNYPKVGIVDQQAQKEIHPKL